MKALKGAFNQENDLVRASSAIVKSFQSFVVRLKLIQTEISILNWIVSWRQICGSKTMWISPICSLITLYPQPSHYHVHLHKSADGGEQILVKMLYFTAGYLHLGAHVPEQLRPPRPGAAEVKCSWFICTLSWREDHFSVRDCFAGKSWD